MQRVNDPVLADCGHYTERGTLARHEVTGKSACDVCVLEDLLPKVEQELRSMGLSAEAVARVVRLVRERPHEYMQLIREARGS